MIFAAGLGTRLKPLTDTTPKALLPLAGKTLIEWQIGRLKAAGIHSMVINIHHFADQIKDYVHAHQSFGCDIRFSDESNQLLETGGGLLKAFHDGLLRTDEPTIVSNVDILSNIDLKQYLRAWREDDMASVVVSDRETQRYMLFAGTGELRGWTNKATGEYKPSMVLKEQDLVPMAFSGMQIVGEGMAEQLKLSAKVRGAKFGIVDAYLDIVARQSGIVRAYIPRY